MYRMSIAATTTESVHMSMMATSVPPSHAHPASGGGIVNAVLHALGI